MMTRLYPGCELPQFQELASEKWEQMDSGTEAWWWFNSSHVQLVMSLSRVQLVMSLSRVQLLRPHGL